MKITYRIDSKLYSAFKTLGFDNDTLTKAIADGMSYFTHIWNNSIVQTTKNARVNFAVGSGYSHWGWASKKGRMCFINPYPGDPNNPLKWSIAGLNHIAHHEAGHLLVYYDHWNFGNYYGDGRFSHVLSLRGRDFFGAFSPYEHWHKRSWGVKKHEAWHPYVRTWLRMSARDRSLNRELLLKTVRPYYELGRNKNQRLHSLIGVEDIDRELREIDYRKSPTILSAQTESSTQCKHILITSQEPFPEQSTLCFTERT